MLALLFCSLARVAAHEVLVDRDPEPRPIRDLELTIHHLELLVHQLVQQRVRASEYSRMNPALSIFTITESKDAARPKSLTCCRS